MTKILKYLLIIMLPLAFAACSKDNDGPKGDDAEIVGTWTGYDEYDDCTWTMDFKSNGNFTWKYGDDGDYGYSKGYYEYNSDMVYLYITEDEDERYDEPRVEYFDCIISGKTMTLTNYYTTVTLKKK